jgi:hypothetical protein
MATGTLGHTACWNADEPYATAYRTGGKCGSTSGTTIKLGGPVTLVWFILTHCRLILAHSIDPPHGVSAALSKKWPISSPSAWLPQMCARANTPAYATYMGSHRNYQQVRCTTY